MGTDDPVPMDVRQWCKGLPWRQRWRCQSMGRQHRALISGRAYLASDAFVLELAMAGRQAPLPLWATFAEAREAGLSVRRGSKGMRLGLADGGPSQGKRTTCVFNVCDLVGPGLQPLLRQRRKAVQAMHAAHGHTLCRAERLMAAWPIPLSEQGLSPTYRLDRDQILLPSRQTFVCREAFLAAWARGLILATGHPTRLARREWNDPGPRAQQREDYVCEMAWTLLADRLGLDRECGVFKLAEADWNWLLTESSNRFFDLIADASHAVDYLAPADEN